MFDGDFMEGIVFEVVFFVGYLGLGKFIYLCDDNFISIDGFIDLIFTEDCVVCFVFYGWYIVVVDGYDVVVIVVVFREV